MLLAQPQLPLWMRSVTTNARSYRECAGWNGSGEDRCSGRRTLDKTVSSKPLAFAVGAVAMGIQCDFGTLVRVRADVERDRFAIWERRIADDMGGKPENGPSGVIE